MTNVVYTNSFTTFNVAANGRDLVFYANFYHKQLKLKSVRLDLQIIVGLAGLFGILPIETQTTQQYVLFVGERPGDLALCRAFEDYTGAGIGAGKQEGSCFALTRPGKIDFDSFFINQRLRFQFICNNNDLLIDYRYYVSVTAELELL